MTQIAKIEIGITPQTTLKLAEQVDDNRSFLLKSITIKREGADVILYCEHRDKDIPVPGFTIALPYGSWIELAHGILGAFAPSVEH